MPKILLVENMKGVRRSIAAQLKEAGHEVVEAEDGNQAIALLHDQKFSLVISEVLLSAVDGTAVLAYLETLPDKPPVIAMSSGNNQIPAEMALLLARPQATATLKKPFEDGELLDLVEQVLRGLPGATMLAAG